MNIKKAELHVHLEGTISPALAKKLALRNKIHLPERVRCASNEQYAFHDFFDFLKAYDEIAALIKKPQDYYDITFDYLKSNALENTLYVEMMYSPDHAEQASGIPSYEHLQAIQQAINDAESQFNIVGRIIITAVRHYGAQAAIRVAQQAIKEDLPCITGFGLGGDEINFPPKLFQKAYQIASEGGLACTIHAGEFGSPESMLDAMTYLPIKRIGHGVKAINSSEVISQLRDREIILEICPSSNVALGLFANLQQHPLPALLKAGVKLTINSDDPPYFATGLSLEYQRVQEAYNFSDASMQHFTETAIQAAFIDEKTRLKLQTALSLQ